MKRKLYTDGNLTITARMLGILGLLAVVGGIVSTVLALEAPTPRAANVEVAQSKWEYTILEQIQLPVEPFRILWSPGMPGIKIDDKATRIEALQAMGDAGWELVAVIREPTVRGLTMRVPGADSFYFKRHK